jgi:hypothetical protein
MPKLSQAKKKILGALLQKMGSSKSMTDAILRGVQAETDQEGVAATKEIHRQLFKDLKQQHKEGVRFGKVDLQEFLGQDEIPPEFKPLLKKPEVRAEPQGPKINFESPTGWSSEHVPLALHIRKGRKPIGQITLIDDSSFKSRLHSNEIRDKFLSQNPPTFDGRWSKSPVRFGSSHGFKFSYNQTNPPWKSVQYLLEVPGGKVRVDLSACGKDFDETGFEAKLKTLHIVSAAQ